MFSVVWKWFADTLINSVMLNDCQACCGTGLRQGSSETIPHLSFASPAQESFSKQLVGNTFATTPKAHIPYIFESRYSSFAVIGLAQHHLYE